MRRLPILVYLVLAIVLLVLPGVAWANEFVKSASTDLDGDGKSEQIDFQVGKRDFILTIDGKSISGYVADPDGFIVVDIDISDKYKEIAVHTPGPSDDDIYQIYWYDGKSIQDVGRLTRWPTFLGNGIVYANDWMGFWAKRERYVLNYVTHTLVLTPQELYYVGVKGPVQKALTIYKTPEDVTEKEGAVVAKLREKSNALILLWDPSSDCYLIKSESGIMGWVANKISVWKHFQMLPWAD